MERDTIGCSGTLRDLGKGFMKRKGTGRKKDKERDKYRKTQEADIKTDEVRIQ